MLGAGPGGSEYGEHIAHGLFRLRLESFEQIAITVRAVLPADIQRRPSGNDHALREGGAVKQLWGVDRRWLSGHMSALLQIRPEYPAGL
jgi:hypothetical protein